MKTLVIHPKDASTDFLSVIYADKDWTVISENVSTKKLMNAIKHHDRIIMLGHGTEHGLLGFDRYVINSKWVYLLHEKQCVCIWCYANHFVSRYELNGFHTGMIISEFEEAMMLAVSCEYKDIEKSNVLFSSSVRDSVDSADMLSVMQELYVDTDNPIVAFNRENLFQK